MERGGRVLLLALAIAAGGAPRAEAEVYLTQSQALTLAFPSAQVERRAFVLDDTQAGQVERLARARLGTRVIAAYLGWRGDTLLGTAFFETRVVRTMPAVLMVVVSPDTTVARIEVLAFHEPSDYRPTSRWLSQFPGRRPAELLPGRSIRTLGGATLTTRAISDSARLALALYRQLVAGGRKREARER